MVSALLKIIIVIHVVEINLFSIHKYKLWHVIKLVEISYLTLLSLRSCEKSGSDCMFCLSACPLVYTHPLTPKCSPHLHEAYLCQCCVFLNIH